MEFLKDLEKKTNAQIKIKTELEEGGATLAELKSMTDEELAAKFNVDVESEEFQALKEQIDGLPSTYDLAVHVDDAQFQLLIEAITGQDYETWIKVHADTTEAEQEIRDLDTFHEEQNETHVPQTAGTYTPEGKQANIE
jgi:hypothetical protein